jgi:hypothetical protein
MILKERPSVEIRIMRRPDKTLYFEVLVRSVVKPMLKNKGILEFERGINQRGVIGTLAGALAEALCEKYSDTLDPSTVAATAEKAYARLMSENPTVFGIGDELPRAADTRLGRN